MRKAKKITGWVLMLGGGVYLGLLGAQGLSWIINKNSVDVNVPLLVISCILACVGSYMAEMEVWKENWKEKKK